MKRRRIAAPNVDAIRTAVELMNGHGAPTFASEAEKRLATIDLARKLSANRER